MSSFIIKMDKFPSQVKAIMSHYNNLLNQPLKRQLPAQIMAFTSQWSPKLRNFIDWYLYEPIFVSNNKLEASFFGQTHHVIMECSSRNEKIERLIGFLSCLSTYSDLEEKAPDVSKLKHTVIFVENREASFELHEKLSHAGFVNLYLVHDYTPPNEVDKIAKYWNCFDQKMLDVLNSKRKRSNLNMVSNLIFPYWLMPITIL
jgi:superfamily II DNA/RNA helicase